MKNAGIQAGFARLFFLALLALGLAGPWSSSAQARIDLVVEQPNDTATITIEKETFGGTASFDYSLAGFNTNESFSLDTNNANPVSSSTFTVPATGTEDYEVLEFNLPDGWFPSSPVAATCNRTFSTNLNQVENTLVVTLLDVSAGEDIVCKFNNEFQGPDDTATITIQKETFGGLASFDYTLTGPNTDESFSLDTNNGNPASSSTFTVPATGTEDYQVFEFNLPDGWFPSTPVTATCNRRNFSVNIDEVQNRVTVNINDVSDGENIVCTFNNELPSNPTIKITKLTNPENLNGRFPFRIVDILNNRNVVARDTIDTSQNNMATFTVDPGTYAILENVPDGWQLARKECKLDRRVVGQPTNDGVTNIALVAGDELTCTFVDRREKGQIVVSKTTIGGDDKFDFMVSGITFDGASFQLANGESEDFELVTGSYLIEEKNLPAGWTLRDINCGGAGERDGNKITVELDADESIRCTFTNFKEVDERMEDVAKLFINRRVNNLLNHDPDRTRVIRRLDQQSSAAGGAVGYSAGEGGAVLDGPTGSNASTLPGIGSNSSIIGKSQSGGLFAANSGTVVPEHGISPDASHLGHGYAGAGSTSNTGGYASGALPFGLSGDFLGGQPNGKFSLSLSQIRESAQARDARKIADAKAYGQGLGLNGNPYGVAYDAIATSLTPDRIDVWAEGHYSHYDDSTGGYNRDGNFGILYVGTDYALTDWLLLGVLAQFDWTDEDVKQNDLTGGVDGWGWMIGPYMGAKLSDHLYFNARAAGGSSENDISLTDDAAGFRKGSFDTDRWLATAELTGNWYHGAWRFTPSAQIAYGSEDQEAFRNSLGQRIGSNDATVGRLTWGPEIAYRHVMHDGTIVEPLISLEGIWNFDDGGLRLADGTPIGDDDVTGKVEGGLLVRMPSGVSWRAVGDYYGIGDGDLDSYGGQLWLSIPLN